jgi:hypothetical protein
MALVSASPMPGNSPRMVSHPKRILVPGTTNCSSMILARNWTGVQPLPGCHSCREAADEVSGCGTAGGLRAKLPEKPKCAFAPGNSLDGKRQRQAG